MARQPAWIAPAVIGGAVALGLLVFANSAKAASGASASKKPCSVDLKRFNDWLVEKQLAGECAPELSTAPPNYNALVSARLAPTEFNPYVLVLGDGSFWYYPDPSSAPSKSENLKNQFQAYLGTLQGHPADMFMVV